MIAPVPRSLFPLVSQRSSPRTTPPAQITKPHRHRTYALAANLAKAWLWQEQLESGEYATLEELGRANGVDRTYVRRILKLTSLSPEVVDKILAGVEPVGMSLRQLSSGIHPDWSLADDIFSGDSNRVYDQADQCTYQQRRNHSGLESEHCNECHDGNGQHDWV